MAMDEDNKMEKQKEYVKEATTMYILDLDENTFMKYWLYQDCACLVKIINL